MRDHRDFVFGKWMVSRGEMRYDIKLQTPWKRHWPVSAGYYADMIAEAIMPIIEAELAQATADALEAAAQECDRHGAFCKREADKGGEFFHLMARRDEAVYLAGRIRALITADITAKAKEREASLALFAQGAAATMYELRSNNGLVAREDAREAILALANPEALTEHDAKIRREAYLRCAAYFELYGSGEGKHSIFRDWANEADGGGESEART